MPDEERSPMHHALVSGLKAGVAQPEPDPPDDDSASVAGADIDQASHGTRLPMSPPSMTDIIRGERRARRQDETEWIRAFQGSREQRDAGR